MIEADFNTVTARWAMSLPLPNSTTIELKLVKDGRFRMSQLRPHQPLALRQSKHKALAYKIPDVGFDQKPFDIFIAKKCHAFVAIIFYEPRKLKKIFLVDIDTIMNQPKKSLSLFEIEELADYSISL